MRRGIYDKRFAQAGILTGNPSTLLNLMVASCFQGTDDHKAEVVLEGVVQGFLLIIAAR